MANRKLRKSLDGTSASGVLETRVARDMIPLIRQKSYCRGYFPEIEMPGRVFTIPKVTAGDGVYLIDEGEISQDFTSTIGNITLTAKKLMCKLPLSAEIEEDSVVPLVPIIKEELARAFAVAEEKAFLLGDTTAGYGANDVRSAFNGILKTATATPVDLSGAAFDDTVGLAAVSTAMQNLGVYGDDPSQLLMIVSRREAAQIRTWKAFLTINAYAKGERALALTGEIGNIYGMKVVQTSHLPTNLGSGNKSSAVIVHKQAFIIGDRRKFQIKSSEHILMDHDMILLVPSERIAFASRYPDAVVKINNIGPAAA